MTLVLGYTYLNTETVTTPTPKNRYDVFKM